MYGNRSAIPMHWTRAFLPSEYPPLWDSRYDCTLVPSALLFSLVYCANELLFANEIHMLFHMYDRTWFGYWLQRMVARHAFTHEATHHGKSTCSRFDLIFFHFFLKFRLSLENIELVHWADANWKKKKNKWNICISVIVKRSFNVGETQRLSMNRCISIKSLASIKSAVFE